MRTTSGHLIYGGKMELKKHQEPLSVGQQIKNLKALNLLIEDETAAVKFLNSVSYYRFIKAYSLGLKPKNGTYYDGVTFDQLMELYYSIVISDSCYFR